LAPSSAGLLKVKVIWRQEARVILRVKISGVIVLKLPKDPIFNCLNVFEELLTSSDLLKYLSTSLLVV
jgi:hypothetical protein